jgi:quercetin dioxygenase-like cupin family protein
VQDAQAAPSGAAVSRSHGRTVGRWLSTQVATAAILVLMVAAGLIALGGSRFVRQAQTETGIPAIKATHVVNAPEPTDTELMRATITTVPRLTSWVALERTVLDPGKAITLGRGQDRGEGPVVLRVESGTLTLQADGSIQVLPSGSGHARDVAPGTESALQAGDQAFAPSGVVTHWRNDGTTPVSVLDAAMASYTSGWFTTAPGITYDEILGEYFYVPPKPPFDIAVRRITLPPGTTLAVDATPGLEMLQVESGSLIALDPVPGTTAPPFAFDAGTMENRNFRPGRVFRSADNSPVTMLVMTIAPAETATPPPT